MRSLSWVDIRQEYAPLRVECQQEVTRTLPPADCRDCGGGDAEDAIVDQDHFFAPVADNIVDGDQATGEFADRFWRRVLLERERVAAIAEYVINLLRAVQLVERP
jgi:hypothetical protein